MKIYLAARYSRRFELQQYATELRAMGHEITSRWIEGNHEVADADCEPARAFELKQRYASEDWTDVLAAECVINFTESPDVDVPGRSRGGRHVECGLALMSVRCRRVIVVGPRENIFHWLSQVEVFASFKDVKETLRG